MEENTEKAVVDAKGKKKAKKTIFVAGMPFKKKRYLQRIKEDFSIETTSKSTKIITKDCNYLYGVGAGRNFKELNLYMELKRNALKNIEKHDLQFPKKTYTDIDYYCFSDRLLDMELGEVYPKVVEFDVNKAYYTTAYRMRLIDKDFYEKCIGLPKSIRLRLIGSLATQKRRIDYVNGKPMSYTPPKRDDVLRDAWFNIVDYVDSCLKEVAEMCGDRFLFYWVDGIYLEGEGKDFKDILNVITQKYGLDFKEEGVEQMTMELDSMGNQFVGVYKTALKHSTKRKYKPFYIKKRRNYANTDRVTRGV
jgi:hypothetical protein